jgi:hypothetical protein
MSRVEGWINEPKERHRALTKVMVFAVEVTLFNIFSLNMPRLGFSESNLQKDIVHTMITSHGTSLKLKTSGQASVPKDQEKMFLQ